MRTTSRRVGENASTGCARRGKPITKRRRSSRIIISVRCTTQGCVPMLWNRGTRCAVAVAIDGMQFAELDYDDVQIDEVQAVEVYRSTFLTWGVVPQIADFAPAGAKSAI